MFKNTIKHKVKAKSPMDEKQKQEHNNKHDEYVKQLTPFEQSAHRIAKSHLGSSFSLKKSNGYLKWISKK
jgi:hypothetical protein